MSRAPCPPRLRRTRAEMLRLARQRLEGCKGVVKASARIRPALEAVRKEYAAAGDLAGLDACATVSDRVAFWEGYGRNVRRLERLIARLRGAP